MVSRKRHFKVMLSMSYTGEGGELKYYRHAGVGTCKKVVHAGSLSDDAMAGAKLVLSSANKIWNHGSCKWHTGRPNNALRVGESLHRAFREVDSCQPFRLVAILHSANKIWNHGSCRGKG